ncbi:MAG: hypothetical protein M1813_002350 [Trichoglossum hirsutum]|jgi:hypothetical protein|nr:MAG: hypothetical protein M1813_002350 [Trichoglossum hirsutum]
MSQVAKIRGSGLPRAVQINNQIHKSNILDGRQACTLEYSVMPSRDPFGRPPKLYSATEFGGPTCEVEQGCLLQDPKGTTPDRCSARETQGTGMVDSSEIRGNHGNEQLVGWAAPASVGGRRYDVAYAHQKERPSLANLFARTAG